MKSARAQIFEWAEQGALLADNVERALVVTGVTPDGAAWRRFISSLLLWLGVLLVAAGVIFFFAYNWDAMGRFAKFGLAEGLLVVAVIAAWYAGPDTTTGKASLLLAAILTGALLALVGQTYQTGADPYELFGVWALLILPWVLVSRLPALWLFFLLLLNLAVALYFSTFPGAFGIIFNSGGILWMQFALNTAALIAWEFAATQGVGWLRERWAIRIVAAASGVIATILAVWAVLESDQVSPLAFAAYGAWLVGAFVYYRYRAFDLFVLAGEVLSLIVFVASALGNSMLRHGEAGAFLFIAIVVIAMSAAGAWWLKNIASEERKEDLAS